MTTKEKAIVDGLLARDGKITKRFFYTECRPMFNGIIHNIFRDNAEYDEIINDFLLYLLTPGKKTKVEPLRKFGTNSPDLLESDSTYSLISWMKTAASNYFRHIAEEEQSVSSNRKFLVDEDGEKIDVEVEDNNIKDPGADMDANFYFNIIKIERDREVLKKVFFEGKDADEASKELGISKENFYTLKKRALGRLQQAARHAASDKALCSIVCEQYVLDIYGIHLSIEELQTLSEAKGWLTETGVALDNIGNICRNFELKVIPKIEGSLDEIRNCLNNGYQVIAAVDGGELIGNQLEEHIEDAFIGQISDHCVVFLSVDNNTVALYDPAVGTMPLIVNSEHFMDAWNDSGRYFVEISK